MKKLYPFIFIFLSISFANSQIKNYYKSFASAEELKFSEQFINNCLMNNANIPGIYQIKQGWGTMMINKSINNEIIRIGSKTFEHGIGTHAYSEIKVILPDKIKSFSCYVGKDINEFSLRAPSQKLIFSIVAGNKEIWKSKPLSAKEEPVKVNLPMEGVREFTMIVAEEGDTGQGKSDLGHADWADAIVETADGKKIWLDNYKKPVNMLNGIPFSFSFGGRSSSDFLENWIVKSTENRTSDRINYSITWTKPEGDFQVRCEAIQFLSHPAVEWKLFYKNTGSVNSPVLKSIKALNLSMRPKETLEDVWQQNKIHYNRGSSSNKYDFQPVSDLLLPNHTIRLETNEGRSSENYLPFWNIDYSNFGLVGALGWSGSWEAEFKYIKQGNITKMTAGLMDAELFLLPGEEIMSPSVCLLYWEGTDPIRGNNLFRRYMKDQWVPKWNGKDPIMVAGSGGAQDLETVNEENQLDYIKKLAATGTDSYWLDAGWYQDGVDGKWVSGRGNWFPNKKKFPRGLKSLGDEVHKLGMKFILWFDPECVAAGTEIAVKHPDWVIGVNANGLYNLGNPDALKYMIDLMDTRIKEYGVDVFRTDYNIDPQFYWDKNDPKGRKGITENRYIQGLYKFWDELLKRNPGLLIDNCASGGRRIDYETSKRSVPLWRSDVETAMDSFTLVNSQNQNYGLSYFLPDQSTGQGFSKDKYHYRSLTSSSVVLCVSRTDINKPIDLPEDDMRKAIAEIKSYNYLFQADYYPLTPYCLGRECWMALQYDSPERGEGIVTVFRRDDSPVAEMELELKALDPKIKYKLTFIDTGKELRGTGNEIKKITLRLEKKESAVIRYTKL